MIVRKTLWLVLVCLCVGLGGCDGCKPVPQPPVVVPVVSGPREVVILRETEDTSPELAQLVTLLRNGEHADYLAGKKHTLTVLDDDLPEAGRHVENASGIERPTILIYDGSKLLKAAPLPIAADAVIHLIKMHGG